MARVRQGVDLLDLLINGPGQRERAETIALTLQRRSDAGIEVWAGEHALQWCARAVVASSHAGADAVFADELDRGQEEILLVVRAV